MRIADGMLVIFHVSVQSHSSSKVIRKVVSLLENRQQRVFTHCRFIPKCEYETILENVRKNHEYLDDYNNNNLFVFPFVALNLMSNIITLNKIVEMSIICQKSTVAKRFQT